MGTFVGLHNHSEYSALDGYSTVQQMARRAKSLGQDAIALTDHQDCGGHLMFESACKAEGVKPIFGMESYLVPNIEQARSEKWKPKDFSHLVLLAKNQVGLKNLWKISSRAYIEGFYHRALTDWDMLKEHSEGIYGTSACMLSYLAKAIKEDNIEQCYDLIGKYLDVFDDRFYLEMHTWQFMNPVTEKQHQLNADMSKINQGLVQLSKDLSVPLIVVNDAHYSVPEHFEHHNLVWAMSTFDDDKTEERGQTNGHIMGDEEVIMWMEKHGVDAAVTQEAILNTAAIGESVDVEIQRGKYIPTMTASIETDRDIFFRSVADGFDRRAKQFNWTEEQIAVRKERLVSLEIPAIVGKDFDPYFVICADFVAHAKSVGMLVGPGRGSGGGSFVAFCMGITELDPVKYDLPFERFMNPGRNSYPDFDIDFPKSRRKEIIEYIEMKYGKDKVCYIGNYSRRAPKMILKDLCRAMSVPFEDSKAMSKVIENITAQLLPDTGEEEDEDNQMEDLEWEAISNEPSLKVWVEKYPELFDKVRDMVGGIRGTGTHASGILISSQPLMDLIPLRIKKRKEGGKDIQIITTQFENKTSYPDNMEIEKFGFIKFDFLGLRHLDTLTEINGLVNGKLDNGYPDPNYFYSFDETQYDDPEPWKLIKSGNTLGIFQAETPGMTKVGREFHPINLLETADLISANRPGLVRAGLLQEYLDRLNGLKEVKLRHPLLEDILSKTYGMFIYQEQIMAAVSVLAGYTLAEADNVRRIMGKKHQAELLELKPGFIAGCMANPAFTSAVGNPEAVARQLWEDMEYFGSYSFNKAHALAYGMITAWGTYLKEYYMLESMAGLLATDDKEGKPQMYLREVRKMGKKVLPPDVNKSGVTFTPDPEGIRYGLISVRGVGPAAVKEILTKRDYADFHDFIDRTVKSYVKYPAVVNLIKIGAFDSFNPDRGELLMEFMQANKKDGILPDFSDEKTILEMEKELVGDFITKDPMLPFLKIWEDMSVPMDKITDLDVGSIVDIGGKINRVKPHKQKNGKSMAFLDFSNDNDEYSLAVFAFMMDSVAMYLEVDAPILCRCEVTEYQGKKGLKLLQLVRLDYL